MKKIRWGLLSTANINRVLIPAIRNSSRGKLAAVASRDIKKAQKYAQKWDIPIAFGDYQEMLDSGEVDVVYNSLPNHLHAEWSIRAMQAGVHVLCEKPFAASIDETDQMIAASKEYKRVLAEAFMYRHHPQTKIVGEWIKSGKLGEIILVRSIFNFNLTRKEDIRLIPEYGGGALWDIGVYPLSFAQYIYGEKPNIVLGMQILGKSGVDESFSGQMRYSGNKIAQISCSFRSPYYTHAEVIGTKGRLDLNSPFKIESGISKLVFHSKDGDKTKISVPQKELYSGEVEDMHDAILDSAQPYLSLEETRNHIETALALYQSALERKLLTLK
jgi:D-xylose 1-dehydrogenase (NADP+, D-xylono-1,5-lactone-forming)